MISLQNIPNFENVVQEYVKIPARRNFIIKAYRKNWLDNLYDFIGTRDRIVSENPKALPRTVERYLGYVATSIHRDIPFEHLLLAGFEDKKKVSLFHERFFKWFKRDVDQTKPGGEVQAISETPTQPTTSTSPTTTRHVSWIPGVAPANSYRAEGVYSEEEKKRIGNNDYSTIKKAVNERWLQDKERLIGRPDLVENRMKMQALIALVFLVNEDNIRFRPIAELKHFGVLGAQENLISFPASSNEPVFCIFNDVKVQKLAPIHKVLSEPTASAFRLFYETYCKAKPSGITYLDGQVFGNDRSLFRNVSGTPMGFKTLSQQVNDLIGTLGLDGNLTVRVLRVLQINDEMPDKTQSFGEAYEYAVRHNHSVEENMRYNRPLEKMDVGYLVNATIDS